MSEPIGGMSPPPCQGTKGDGDFNESKHTSEEEKETKRCSEDEDGDGKDSTAPPETVAFSLPTPSSMSSAVALAGQVASAVAAGASAVAVSSNMAEKITVESPLSPINTMKGLADAFACGNEGIISWAKNAKILDELHEHVPWKPEVNLFLRKNAVHLSKKSQTKILDLLGTRSLVALHRIYTAPCHTTPCLLRVPLGPTETLSDL